MSLENLLSDTIDIYRASTGVGVQVTYGTAPYNEGVACLIQPIAGEYFGKTNMSYARGYNCLLSLGTDIMISDRVIDEFGKVYQVTGTLNRAYGVNVQHLTVILTEESTAGPDL